MHRHGYQGRKFGRERDQRRALLKGLATSLIEHGSIETTLEKAKDLRPFVEKLVTKAKKGDLHNRRQIIDALTTKEMAHKLVDEIAPKYSKRPGGYLTIARGELRRGDNAQMATISFVETQAEPEAKKPAASSTSAAETSNSSPSGKPSRLGQAKKTQTAAGSSRETA